VADDPVLEGQVTSLEFAIANLRKFIDDLFPTGTIVMWSGSPSQVPEGWALCDGGTYTDRNGNPITTPDLRNRFIVGAGGEYGVGSTGGNDFISLTTAQLPPHSHSITIDSAGAHTHNASSSTVDNHTHGGNTSTEPAHTHTATVSANGSHSHGGITDVYREPGGTIYYASGTNSFAAAGPNAVIATRSTDTAPDHTHTVTIGSAGAHSHVILTSADGAHSHSITIDSAGAHTHTATIGSTGDGAPIDIRPKYYALAYIMRL
jgi:microcystin-dependent protein